MITIFHAPRSRSVRPIWLCYELELEIEIVHVSQEVRATQAFKEVSPAGKVPALVDGDIQIVESGAIIDYLLERYGKGRFQPSPGTRESAMYRQWCWFAEATLIRPLGLYRVLRAEAESSADLATEAKTKFREAMAMLESGLTGQEFLVGDQFSAADIMMGYSLAMAEPLLGERYPNTQRYLSRLQARDAFQRVLALDEGE